VNNGLKTHRRKRSWPNLRYYPDIRLKGMRKVTKNLGLDNRCPSLGLNPLPPKYVTETLPFESTCPMVGCVGEKFLPLSGI
jgi:hypothetical protein